MAIYYHLLLQMSEWLSGEESFHPDRNKKEEEEEEVMRNENVSKCEEGKRERSQRCLSFPDKLIIHQGSINNVSINICFRFSAAELQLFPRKREFMCHPSHDNISFPQFRSHWELHYWPWQYGSVAMAVYGSLSRHWTSGTITPRVM